MPHSVVYPGNFDDLMKKWKEEEDKKTGKYIANGQCVRLPQELTNVGHTSRWQPGELVIDVARTLKPGTVIASFLFEYDKMWFPNSHGWHAALFVRADGFSTITGKPRRIWMFDQWIGRVPHVRYVDTYTDEYVKQKPVLPCDNSREFFVVKVS